MKTLEKTRKQLNYIAEARFFINDMRRALQAKHNREQLSLILLTEEKNLPALARRQAN